MTTRKTRWGDGFTGDRLPEYRIVVTEQTQHGNAKRHTFVLDPDTVDEPGGPHWHRYSDRRLPPAVPEWALLPGMSGEQQRWASMRTVPLPDVVHLSQGVDVPAVTLVVIFEALVSQEQHRIDLAHVKRIVSQLGWRIAQLGTLPPEQRRIAEPALYTEILARCVSM